jgi:hypothetical protein
MKFPAFSRRSILRERFAAENPMTLVLLLAALLFPQAPAPANANTAYDLNGEAPGMTLKQFKSDHTDADCTRRKGEVTCRVMNEVSLSGMESLAYEGCRLPECEAQGLTARFSGDKLVSITYGVSGSYIEMVKLLKERFGPPADEDSETTKWQNSVGYLTATKTLFHAGDGSIQFAGVRVISALNGTETPKPPESNKSGK